MENINKKVILTVLVAGCFLSTLNQTLLNVALSNLMEVFSVSATTVQWMFTGFMLVNGILVPITAYLMKRFTTRQLFISSMSFLLIGSILCAIAPTFTILLIGRMIQAVGAGIVMPLLMSVVMFLFPPEKRGTMMGYIGFAIIFAPAIAPTLSGFVIEYLSWRWLFIGLIPLFVIILLLSIKYLVNVTEKEESKLDVTSVILSTIGFGLILYGFSSAGNSGWNDSIVLSSIIIGLITITLFCMRQIKSSDPLLNLDVFKNKLFTITTIINVMITMMMYADMILLPLYLQDGRSFTAFEAGLVLLPGAIINAFLSPVTGKIYDRYGAKFVFVIGLIFIIPSMWVVTDLTESTTFTFLMIRTIFLRIGLSFITMPLNTANLNALSTKLVSHGTAINNTIRQLSGAVGTAIIITIFTAQTSGHAENLSQDSPNASNATIQSLASVLGSSDAYYFMTILAIIALLLVLFVPSQKKLDNPNT